MSRMERDAGGNQVVQRTEPGNLVLKESHEASGRVLGFVDADGVATTYGYGPHWGAPPISIVRADRRVELALDALGQVTRASEQNAALAGPASRTMSIERDVAGRVAAVGDAQGFQARTSWDTEGHALVAGLHEPGQALPLRANYRWFDERGRLIRRLMADGRIDSWSYDEAQQQVSHQDGEDVMHVTRNVPGIGRSELHMTTDGLLRAHWSGRDAAAKTTQRDGTPLVRRDDFGRPVFEWRPESGLILRSFDAADRLTREDLIDRLAHPAGHRTLQFDVAGHVVQRQSFDAAGQVVKTARWTFGGTRVMTEEDGVQSTRYTYDAAGRVAARSTARAVRPSCSGMASSCVAAASKFAATTHS